MKFGIGSNKQSLAEIIGEAGAVIGILCIFTALAIAFGIERFLHPR